MRVRRSDAAVGIYKRSILIDDLLKGLNAGCGMESVFGRIDTIVNQLIDGTGRYVHPGVGGGVVNEYLSVVVGDPAVAEYDIGYIAYSFFPDGCYKVASRFIDDPGQVFEVGHKQIEGIAQACGGVSDAVGEVQPAQPGFDRRGTQTILCLINGMIDPWIDDDFFVYDGICDRCCKAEGYPAAAAGVDKAVLGTGVESVFAFYQFRMEDDVPLLGRAGLQICQSFPGHKVFCAGNSALGDSGGLVSRRSVGVSFFRTEESVDPAVFMFGQPDIVDIGLGLSGTGHVYGRIPEAEMIDAVWAFRDGKKGFPIPAFDPYHHNVAVFPFNRSGIEDPVDAKPFHQEGVGLLIEIISPEEGRMTSRQHRVTIPVEDTVARHLPFIGSKDQLRIMLIEPLNPFFKLIRHHSQF